MVSSFATKAREIGILVNFDERVGKTYNKHSEMTAPHQVICKICSRISKTAKIHKDHFRGSHDHETNKVSRSTTYCRVCGYGKNVSNKKLSDHMTTEHSVE